MSKLNMPLLLHTSVRELAQGYVFSLDIEPTGDIIDLDCGKGLLNVNLYQAKPWIWEHTGYLKPNNYWNLIHNIVVLPS